MKHHNLPPKPNPAVFPLFFSVSWKQLPEIDLYMDQVLTYLERIFGEVWVAEQSAVTASMINNYVKQDVVPRPKRKQYGRLQLSSIILLLILKYVYSLEEIRCIFKILQEDPEAWAEAYDWFTEALDQACRSAKEQPREAASLSLPEPPHSGPAWQAFSFGLHAYLSRQQGRYFLEVATASSKKDKQSL